MKDFIWTIIIIWLLYKIFEVFRANPNRKVKNTSTSYNSAEDLSKGESSKDEEIKSAIQKHLNKEGEYVDFEEMK